MSNPIHCYEISSRRRPAEAVWELPVTPDIITLKTFELFVEMLLNSIYEAWLRDIQEKNGEKMWTRTPGLKYCFVWQTVCEGPTSALGVGAGQYLIF